MKYGTWQAVRACVLGDQASQKCGPGLSDPGLEDIQKLTSLG